MKNEVFFLKVKIKFFLSILLLILLSQVVIVGSSRVSSLMNENENKVEEDTSTTEEKSDISKLAVGITDNIDNDAIKLVAVEIERYEVLDGLTMEELGAKLNKSLKGVIANKGDLIAERSIELGIDPYMAVAIMLHETGCSYHCSSLARINYNVGGMKGRSGKYQKFSSIDAGINAFLNNLYNNYYKYGLNTPETINPKYAGSTSWAGKIRQYMVKIKDD